MSRSLTAVLVGMAILIGVAVNFALVVFSVLSTRDIVRLDSQVRELTSVVAVLKQSLQEASSSSELRLETLNSSFTTSLLAVSSNQTALASRQDDLERWSVPLMSCQQYRDSGYSVSGVYTLNLWDGQGSFPVYCDMASDGYGWVVFQRRVDGSEDFYRTWADYKAGFGRLEAEFWLGNDKLHRLTSAGLTRLRVDLGDWQNNTAYALYSVSVAGEEDNYRLNVSGYSGTARDSLRSHSGLQFSTRDKDNDASSGDNCAVARTGAWWYDSCTESNLNGLYNVTATGDYRAVFWFDWKIQVRPLKATEMKVR